MNGIARKIFGTPIRRAIAVLLLLNGIPTYQTMFNALRPSWTAPNRLATGEPIAGRYFQRGSFDIKFGMNAAPFDASVQERWHRIRVGFPFSPITIDVEQRAWRLQGLVETNWLALKLLFSLFVWGTLETVAFVGRRAT